MLISKADHLGLQATIPKFRKLIEELKAKSFDASQRRILSNISYSAEEKYLNFMNTYPNIFYRIPLNMIASFLGVSRETLSRIRKRTSSIP
ncbi:cyclic nucleotide-binding domain-containing protein [Mucilaginibacter pedocola]|uniref:hypothetical protein n=1 Tax=Mucilaginibacter pedocola TaxID=1792845 RepID=UPI00192E4E63|nr:hypothetical protein [Mucilaginibacter pedocola]